MNDTQFRPASSTDFRSITSVLENDGFNHAYPLSQDRYNKLLVRGEKFYILLTNKQVIGVVSFDIDVRIQLHFFSIRKNFQKMGYGTKMLEFILKEVNKYKTYHPVIFCYLEVKSPIVNFLLKHKFHEVGHYKNRFGNGRDAIILERSALLT